MTTSAGEKMAPVLRGIAEHQGTQSLSYGPNTYVWDLRVNIIILKAGLLQRFVIAVL